MKISVRWGMEQKNQGMKDDNYIQKRSLKHGINAY